MIVIDYLCMGKVSINVIENVLCLWSYVLKLLYGVLKVSATALMMRV